MNKEKIRESIVDMRAYDNDAYTFNIFRIVEFIDTTKETKKINIIDFEMLLNYYEIY